VFFQEFLKDALDPDDTVTRAFIETMLPALIEHYTDMSAKGGDHSRDKEYDEQARRIFEEKDDQSMLSHQLNGLFPTIRLMNLLEEEELGFAPFLETERSVYILSYLMHDVDKIVRIRGLVTKRREDIEQAKDIIAGQLRMCRVEQFFPKFEDYLEDIAFLVVNTQQKHGTHISTFGWDLRLKEKRLFELRRFCTYSDQIAYLVQSPAAILTDSETQYLTLLLSELSEHRLVFSYHQLREVRGLLTNVVNNGLVRLFTEGREGVWPYLFFADGVVYIKRSSLNIRITTEQVVETVREQLRTTCFDTIKNFAPGFKFSIQGIAKHPGYYFEFLTLEEYAALLVKFTIERTKNDISATPLEKIQQLQVNREIDAGIPTNFSPDPRIGMISRFLSVVFLSLLGTLDKKQQTLREQVETTVVRHLGLEPYWEMSKAIPNKGGVEYRWFWLGACYLRDHPGIHEYQGDGNLTAVFTSTMGLVLEMAGDALRQQMLQKYLGHLTRYLDSVIDLPLSASTGGTLPDFADELARYEGAKGKKHTLICTLCNSAYPAEEQSDNAVLFQPWVYKNKLSLYAGKNAGGICVICALELMLRQILQKGQLRLTGSKFEALKTKFISVYPNFFFTAETGAMVQGVLDQLQDINFFTIRRKLEGRDITIRDVLELDAFAASEKKGEEESASQAMPEEPAEDEENEKEAISEPVTSHERSYIKFHQNNYPGLCFFGMKAGKDDDDTSSWAMPAFLALTLPLVTGTKVVTSEMSLPLFSSGRDFRETVVFDAPHPFLDRLLKTKRMRVNELLRKLRILASMYRVNLDTYASKGRPEWKHLNAIARDLDTDPLLLFSYLHEQERRAGRDSMISGEAQDYLRIYETILEADVSKIEQSVNLYRSFYRGGYQSHSILKPVDIVAKAIINSPLNIEKDDLLWQIQGELQSWLDRVRSHQATGRAMFWGKEISEKEPSALRHFVTYFYNEVFLGYCQGERGILRSRINQFRDGCEAYYVYLRSQEGRGQETEDEDAEPMPV